MYEAQENDCILIKNNSTQNKNKNILLSSDMNKINIMKDFRKLLFVESDANNEDMKNKYYITPGIGNSGSEY